MRYARTYGVEATPFDRLAARAANRTRLYGQVEGPIRLALGELRTATRLATADFLAFDFTRIAGDESGFAQRRPQGLVVSHERASNAVANRTGLPGDSAALDMRFDIEFPIELYRAERLLHDHSAGLSAEELSESPAIDRYLARALTQINPSARRLAA